MRFFWIFFISLFLFLQNPNSAKFSLSLEKPISLYSLSSLSLSKRFCNSTAISPSSSSTLLSLKPQVPCSSSLSQFSLSVFFFPLSLLIFYDLPLPRGLCRRVRKSRVWFRVSCNLPIPRFEFRILLFAGNEFGEFRVCLDPWLVESREARWWLFLLLLIFSTLIEGFESWIWCIYIGFLVWEHSVGNVFDSARNWEFSLFRYVHIGILWELWCYAMLLPKFWILIRDDWYVWEFGGKGHRGQLEECWILVMRYAASFGAYVHQQKIFFFF